MSGNMVQLDPVFIKLDGANLDNPTFRQLEMVEVDKTIGAPDMVTLYFYDPVGTLASSTTWKLGAILEVSALAGTAPVVITKVEVCSLEPDFRGDGTDRFIVRGYSKWNRLQGGRRTRTFQQMTDTAIVQKLAGEVGLQHDCAASSITYPFVMQWQQTDMEFLQMRADRIGFELYVDGEKLTFKAPPTSVSSADVSLDYGVTLGRFQPRFAIIGQANTVKVQGWDLVKKEAIVGSGAPAITQGGMGKTGASAAQTALSRQVTDVITDGTVIDATDAGKLAKAIAERYNGAFVDAEGETTINPSIAPGKVVEIKNVPANYAGKYRVTAVRHIWTQSGFSTRFTVAGVGGTMLTRAIEGPAAPRRIPNMVVGIVTNHKDPDNLGRIRVKLPTEKNSLGEEIESFWARLATPLSGPQTGMLFMPEMNDEVLVGFLDGNTAQAVILGCLWNGKDKPPLTNSVAVASNGKVNQRIIKTKVGHTILIDDTENAELIKITDKAGNFLLLDSGNKLIHLKEANGCELKMDGQGKSVLLKSPGTMTIESAQGMTIKGQQIAMESTGGNVTIKATANLELTANANGAFKANANLDLQANGMATLKTSAILTIQGSLVKIN